MQKITVDKKLFVSSRRLPYCLADAAATETARFLMPSPIRKRGFLVEVYKQLWFADGNRPESHRKAIFSFAYKKRTAELPRRSCAVQRFPNRGF